MGGWIKLHLQTLDNEIFQRDPTAWRVFEYLLLRAYTGKPQGTTTTTRQQIANALFINNNTVWSALLRLKKAKMINSSGNSRFSTVRICNWHGYQGNGQQPHQQLSNNPSTTEQHSYKNKIENKNIPNGTVETRAQVQQVYDHYILAFKSNPNQYRLTDKRKAKLRSRVKDAGVELLIRAIDSVASSAWHMGDNDRGWKADLDYIVRSYEQVEKLAQLHASAGKDFDINKIDWERLK